MSSASTTEPKSGKKRSWLFIAGLLLAVIVVVAIGDNIQWANENPQPSVNHQIVQQVAYAPPAAVVTSPLAAQCDYSNKHKELTDSKPFIFNEGARCITNFTVAEGPIEFNGPSGKFVLQTRERLDRERLDLSQVWFESARAVNGHAVLLYQLVE
ncbi:MAG: hypothetical protein V4436_03210 [Patescibacteria group bacterium]